MQVIPLSGGENFWGVDFLAAYVCSDEQRHYSWQLTPSEFFLSSFFATLYD